MDGKRKFKEADHQSQEGPYPRSKYDAIRGGASGSSHVQTKNLGCLGKVTEMAQQVLTKVLDACACCSESDQEKQINEITKDIKESIENISTYKEQYKQLCDQTITTIDKPVDAMLKPDSVHRQLSDEATIENNIRPIQTQRWKEFKKYDELFNDTSHIKEYYGMKGNNIDKNNLDDYLKDLEQFQRKISNVETDLRNSLNRFSAVSNGHKKIIADVWQKIKVNLEKRYEIKLSKDNAQETLEMHIYQDLPKIIKHTKNEDQLEVAKSILSGILTAGLKATGEQNKRNANEKVIEKLFVMLKDKESFSLEERKSIIEVIGYIGSKYPTLTESHNPVIRKEMYGGDAEDKTFSDKNDVANRVAKKLFLILDDKEKFSQELHKPIMEELGRIGSAKEGVAEMIAKQLFDICFNREFTLEQRKYSIEAINDIKCGLWKHQKIRQCIINIVASNHNDLEPELQQVVKEILKVDEPQRLMW